MGITKMKTKATKEEGKEVAEEGTKTLECKVLCVGRGTKFSSTLERYYVARGCMETGDCEECTDGAD